MTGMLRRQRNQHSLRGIVIDDQKLQRASCAAVRRVRRTGRNLRSD
jgi:hypothetical protein